MDLASLDPASVLVKVATGPVADATAPNTAPWRLAEIGAANGHGNARSVARVMLALALGGTVPGTGGSTGSTARGGVRLLTPATIEHVFREQAHGIDLFLGVPIRFASATGFRARRGSFLPEGRVCFWGGWGGSMIIMDLDRRTTISYMMNRMQPGWWVRTSRPGTSRPFTRCSASGSACPTACGSACPPPGARMHCRARSGNVQT